LPHPTSLPRLLAPLLCFNSCTALIILLHPQGLCAHSQSRFAPFSSHAGLIILLHPTPLPPLSLLHLRFVLTHVWASSTCFAHSPAPSPSHALALSHLSVWFRSKPSLNLNRTLGPMRNPLTPCDEFRHHAAHQMLIR